MIVHLPNDNPITPKELPNNPGVERALKSLYALENLQVHVLFLRKINFKIV